jgi:hypothetical protein
MKPAPIALEIVLRRSHVALEGQQTLGANGALDSGNAVSAAKPRW